MLAEDLRADPYAECVFTPVRVNLGPFKVDGAYVVPFLQGGRSVSSGNVPRRGPGTGHVGGWLDVLQWRLASLAL